MCDHCSVQLWGSLWSYSWSKNSFFFHASLRLFLPPGDMFITRWSILWFISWQLSHLVCLPLKMLWSLFCLQVLRLHLQVVEKKLLDLVGEGGLGPPPPSSFHPFYSPSFALFLFPPNNTLRDLRIDCSIKCYVYVSLLFKKWIII